MLPQAAISSGGVIVAFLGGFWTVGRDGHTCGLNFFVVVDAELDNL